MVDTADLPAPAPAPTPPPALARLEDQLDWHNRKAGYNQAWYRRLKLAQLVIAAAVPVFALVDVPRWIAAALAAVVVVIEGVNQLYGFHDTWINYRATCEALSREKYLYLSSAGPYTGNPAPTALLAENVESILSRQHGEWTSSQKPPLGKTKPG